MNTTCVFAQRETFICKRRLKSCRYNYKQELKMYNTSNKYYLKLSYPVIKLVRYDNGL